MSYHLPADRRHQRRRRLDADRPHGDGGRSRPPRVWSASWSSPTAWSAARSRSPRAIAELRAARRAVDQTCAAGEHRRHGTRRGAWNWRTATRCSATPPTTPPRDGRSGRRTDFDGRTTDGVGLLDRPGMGGAAGLGRGVRALGMRADRPDRQGVARPQRPGAPGAHSAAAEDRQGARAVGHPPRPASRRPRLRPDEAGAAQRDPRPVRMRADRIRFAGTRFRQQRDPRPLRDARAEGALPRAAARQPDRVVLLDDRTAGRRRPEGVHHRRRSRTATTGSSTARSGSPRSPRWRRSSS